MVYLLINGDTPRNRKLTNTITRGSPVTKREHRPGELRPRWLGKALLLEAEEQRALRDAP